MEPLASRLRPKTLDAVLGQEHLVGPNKPIRVAIERNHAFSFILWGPPGTGKTTIARIYAHSLGIAFHELSAVSAGKDDIRKIVERGGEGAKVALFLDEIHRFTKAQQDFLLPYVEDGRLLLIGATTENPSFEVIPALLSRCRVFVLEPLGEEALREIIRRTKIRVSRDAFDWLLGYANGDARRALTLLEGTSKLYGSVTPKTLGEALESVAIRYDRKGEEHYDTISAFIKSMRASKVDAALYYLARMVAAGEDPLFIARRMVVFASEDVGLAQPTALVVANAVFRACETVGYPECAINLGHGAAYLAQARKSRAAYEGLRAAQADVAAQGNLPIPKSLRNAPTKLMQKLGYGSGYELYGEGEYLPDQLAGKRYLREE